MHLSLASLVLLAVAASVSGQRISTIQLDGTQYFISKQNPYAPELNFFLAYQYCRSIGLQLASFETREKADAIAMYLKNAKYNTRDFWTSGNKLGTNMMLWMSSGLPFNATFDYMRDDATSSEDPEVNSARNLDVSALGPSCMALTGPELAWRLHDCGQVKDFICEQTRCYYYNYGTIPVSATQGKPVAAASSPSVSTASFSAAVPTTPYPGLFDNSVAPEDDLAEAAHHDEEVAATHEEEQSSTQQEDEDDDVTVMSVTTSPHQHQPKRLEDLFPLERTRPIAWPVRH